MSDSSNPSNLSSGDHNKRRASHKQPPPDETSRTNDVTLDKLESTVIGSVRWVLVEAWGGRLLQVATFVALGRLLEPRDFGLVALAASIAAIISLLTDAGFSSYIVAQRTLTRTTEYTAFWSALFLGLAMMAGLVAFSTLIARAVGQESLRPILQVMAIALPLGAVESVLVSRLQRQFGFRLIAMRRLMAASCAAAIGIALALMGAGAWALVAHTIATPTIGLIVISAGSPWRPHLVIGRNELATMMRYGSKLAASNFLGMSNRHLDKLVVGSLLGPAELGYYAVAFRLVTLLLDFSTTAISSLALPTLSRLQADPPRLARAFLRAARVSGGLGHAAFLTLAAASPVVVPLVLGDQWRPSVTTMQVLCLLGVVQVVTYLDRSLLLAVQRPDLELKLSLTATILDAAALAIGVQFGVVGVATAIVVRAFLFFPIRGVVRARAAGVAFGPFTMQFARSLIPAACAAAIVYAVNSWLIDLIKPGVVLALNLPLAVLANCTMLLIFNRPLLRELLNLLRQATRSSLAVVHSEEPPSTSSAQLC